MKIKYLAIPSIAISLLLTGCGQKDNGQDEGPKNKQEQKKKDSKKEKSKEKTTNNSTKNNPSETSQQNNNNGETVNTSNNQQETQAEANQRMQEESRSEHNGLSNAEYAVKINEEANNRGANNPYKGATLGDDGHYYSPSGRDLGNPEAGGSTPTVGSDSDSGQRAFNPDIDE
ncbi:hypothetical protein [Staphylococcus warneri]|uniref:hypothetical protein n=1 Tax=Staphylococcus warneri TaxID=1292 RepID=UPI0001A5CCC6|nr:hypothetical protein [Staphylococcus warneri]EEQ81010.1 hypothetical protein STAWA0001_0310 [Staphylococcus warneri L37603]MCJ1804544.1 hypothetical protein [Staphylococcus warneri]